MGDITRSLSRFEYACRCDCGMADPHPRLVIATQELVDASGATKITVTSGSRCASHNAHLENIGAAQGSKHLRCPSFGDYTLAADYVFHGVLLSKVVNIARTIPEFKDGGIGLYVGRTDRLHLDIRGHRARWGRIDGKEVTFQDALSELFRRQGT